jgi:hypothetical protein
MSGGVFISYRREDTRGFAGRIYDRLSDRLGSENVFFDVDNIAPGLDFVEVLTERVAACDALVAVIGKDWLASADKTGHRRLDNAEDFVRVEIEAALKRGVRVIPVLVEDAAMPQADELPESLRKLARRQGIAIDHARFNSDVERLIRVLSEIEDEAHRASPPDAPAAAAKIDATPARDAGGASETGAMARRRFAPLVFAAAAVVAILALGAVVVLRGRAPEPAPPAADVTHPSNLATLGASSSAPAASDPAANAAPPLIGDPSALLGPSAKLLNAAAPNSATTASPASPSYATGKEETLESLTRQIQDLTALQKQQSEELGRQDHAAQAALKDLIKPDPAPSANATTAGAAPEAVAPAQQWLSRGDFEADVKKQFAAGNYPDKAWGRCRNGIPEAGAHWSPRPPGQHFEFRGANNQDFAAKNAEFVAYGYVLQYDNTFANCDGSTRHQALWMKGS